MEAVLESVVLRGGWIIFSSRQFLSAACHCTPLLLRQREGDIERESERERERAKLIERDKERENNVLLIGFFKFIQTFGRIGDELFIEARQREMVLSTVNSSRSAFAILHLRPGFFSSYKGPSPPSTSSASSSSKSSLSSQHHSQRETSTCYKVLLKVKTLTKAHDVHINLNPILTLFQYAYIKKTMNTIFKQKVGTDNIDQCKMFFQSTESGDERLVIQLICSSGVSEMYPTSQSFFFSL
jgi:hypothetical protein